MTTGTADKPRRLENTVRITGSVCLDLRSPWQKFKDLFKPKRKLVFDNVETIVHDESNLKIPNAVLTGAGHEKQEGRR